jgi:hypothetical protein
VGNPTANWSAECLWDCTWKINPYVGQYYRFIDPKNSELNIGIIFAMPKVPVDLRCLDGCTDIRLPAYLDPQTLLEVDCGNSPLGSFLGCYMYYSNLYNQEPPYIPRDVPFLSSTYFHLAVESCVLAVLEPGLYPQGNCDEQGVHLRVYNPFVGPPFLYSSLPLNSARLQGPASDGVLEFSAFYGLSPPATARYPWLCSLSTSGFRSRHRCGVTLLSAPPKPTIFASAAHCNYVCKDEANEVVEICCCNDPANVFSCSSSSFCGANATMQLANPEDLQIVCNITNQADISSTISTRIKIKEIRNHPNYIPLAKDSSNGGPIGGSDICVYIVDDVKLAGKLNPNYLWPACLPRSDDESYIAGNRGILAGWNEQRPPDYILKTTLQDYISQYLVTREALFELQPECRDPDWMQSNTYYPPGTVCYTEAAWAASVQFGLSGSGLLRPFISANGTTAYSWVGPLSISKGSDRTKWNAYTNVLIDYSSNPTVFTDARCYMDWISGQYGLNLPANYSKPASCSVASGDRFAVNNTSCLSWGLDAFEYFLTSTKCDFTSYPGHNKCRLYTDLTRNNPFFRHNFYYCLNEAGREAVCANDCPGVDPNAVVVEGELALTSLVAATALSVPGLLEPALGVATAAGIMSLGQMAMHNNNRTRAVCPPGECRIQGSCGRCCPLVVVNRRSFCPLAC